MSTECYPSQRCRTPPVSSATSSRWTRVRTRWCVRGTELNPSQRVDETSRCEHSLRNPGRRARCAESRIRCISGTLVNIAKLRAGLAPSSPASSRLAGWAAAHAAQSCHSSRARQAGDGGDGYRTRPHLLAGDRGPRPRRGGPGLAAQQKCGRNAAPQRQVHAAPVGNVPFDASIDALLNRASELLHHAPICDLLRECYAHQPDKAAQPSPAPLPA